MMQEPHTTLGIIKQLGEVGVALSTLVSCPTVLIVLLCQHMYQAIALYTFIGVWMGRAIQSKRVTGAVIGVIWFFIGLLTLLGIALNGGARGGFERPTPVILFYSTIFLSLLMN